VHPLAAHHHSVGGAAHHAPGGIAVIIIIGVVVFLIVRVAAARRRGLLRADHFSPCRDERRDRASANRSAESFINGLVFTLKVVTLAR
jgi:hypothetical protein